MSQKRCKKGKKAILQLANTSWKNRWGFRLFGYQRLIYLGKESIFTKYFLNCQFTESENTAELKTPKGRGSCSSCDKVRELPSIPSVPAPNRPWPIAGSLPQPGFREQRRAGLGALPPAPPRGQRGVEGADPFSRLQTKNKAYNKPWCYSPFDRVCQRHFPRNVYGHSKRDQLPFKDLWESQISKKMLHVIW